MKYIALLIGLLSLATLGGCEENTVVLLEGPDGKTGRVIVTPKGGEPVELSEPFQALSISSATGTASIDTMPQTAMQETFAETLAAEPQPPLKFRLYFLSESTTLTPSSQALLAEVVQAVEKRESTDISIIGHTDRAGDRQYNLELSRKRALSVAETLLATGVDKKNIEINSHGENNPIVPTADGVHSRKNRRVEVTVR